MENHINDIKKIMQMDNYKDEISSDLLIGLFKSYIQKINCYERLCLLILNKILLLCGKEEIKNVKDFKIIRKDLIKVDGIKFYNDNKIILDFFFHKNKDLYYYQKQIIKFYILTLLNCILKKSNFELRHYQKNVYNKKILTFDTFYYIN